MKKLFFAAAIAALTSCTSKQRVNAVHDGDTFYTSSGAIRVYGVDCPEIGQPYAQEARRFTDSLVYHKTVRIRVVDTSYGRKVCKVYINGQDLSALLVQHGLAWAYKKYAPPGLYQLEQTARKNHIGLWAQTSPQPPFIYRQNKKLEQ